MRLTAMNDDSPFFNADTLVSLGRVTAVAPSPDGTWIAVAVSRLDADKSRYVSDLWRVALDSAREPIALTRTDSNDRAPAFRCNGSLCFLSDRNPREAKPQEGDDTRAQVWELPVDGGEPRPITDEPLGVLAFKCAAGADRLVLLAPVLPGVAHDKQRDEAAERKKKGPSALRYDRLPVRHWDHWLPRESAHVIFYDLATAPASRRDLTPDAVREYAIDPDFDVSRDGRAIAITHAALGPDDIDDLRLEHIDTVSARRTFVARPERTMHACPRFSPDGTKIACHRHVRSEREHGTAEPWIFDVATGDGRAAATSWDDAPHALEWSGDGRALFATVDHRGLVPVVRIDATTGAVSVVTALSAGGCHDAIAVVPSRGTIVGLRHRWSHPPEPFRVDPVDAVAAVADSDAVDAVDGATPTLLARLSGFDADVATRHAMFSSHSATHADGSAVPYFVAQPVSREGERATRSTLLWIHGGPRNQWVDGWHWRWNVLAAVAQGHAVVLPNPRGSTGYGRAHVEAIWRNRWGAECYEDLLAVTDDVAVAPWCDRSRIAAMGASYGGYMVNWIGGHTDRFKCIVAHASIFAFNGLHGVGDHPAWWRHEIGADPYDAPDEHARYSPHRFVSNWKTPTLIVHGANDFRCPISEGLALFEALQHRRIPSELVVFPDENHWILKPRNAVAWYETVFEYLRRHLA